MTVDGYTFRAKVFGPAQFVIPGSEHQDRNFARFLSVKSNWRFEIFTNKGGTFVPAGYRAETIGLEFGPSGELQFFLNDNRLGNCEWKVHVQSWPTYRFKSQLVDFKVDGFARNWQSEAQPVTRKLKRSDSSRQAPPKLSLEAAPPGFPTNFPPMDRPDFEFGWLRAMPKTAVTQQDSWMQLPAEEPAGAANPEATEED